MYLPVRTGASTSILRPVTSLDMMGESTKVGLVEATLRIMVFNRPAPHANARSVRHSAHSTQGAVLGPHRLVAGSTLNGPGVVWVYVTDIY